MGVRAGRPRRDDGFQAGQPLLAFLLGQRAGFVILLAWLSGVAGPDLLLKQAQRDAVGTDRQGRVHQQPLVARRRGGHQPQPRGGGMVRPVQHAGVLHGQHQRHGLHALLGRLHVAGQDRLGVDIVIVKEALGRVIQYRSICVTISSKIATGTTYGG